MDERKVTSGDDEFHFTEAEEAKSSGPYTIPMEDSLPEKKTIKINRRKILIAIGIIVVALSIYKLIGVFLESGSSKKLPVAVMSTPVTTINAPQSVIPAETSAPITTIQPAPVQQVNNNAVGSEQLSAVSNQVSALSNSVTNLTNQVSALTQQMQSLASQLQSQQVAVSQLKFKSVPTITKIIYKPLPPPPPIWYIQAMVPGRAWLIQSNNITTKTVAKGDLLPGYGRIIYISAVRCLVKTSTGAILQYKSI